MYKFLNGHFFLFLLGVYLVVGLLIHVIIPCLMPEDLSRLFSKATGQFFFPTCIVSGF